MHCSNADQALQSVQPSLHSVPHTFVVHLSALLSQEEIPASEVYEHSELLSYKALVLAEGGQPGPALALLDKEQVRQ